MDIQKIKEKIETMVSENVDITIREEHLYYVLWLASFLNKGDETRHPRVEVNKYNMIGLFWYNGPENFCIVSIPDEGTPSYEYAIWGEENESEFKRHDLVQIGCLYDIVNGAISQ